MTGQFTKQEERFIKFIDDICELEREIGLYENGENQIKRFKELRELKKEFFDWFKNQIKN